jgi:transcriptional regulator with XRE-family HTH domain
MKVEHYTMQLTMPKVFCQALGRWVRALRQRERWTQAMLASRAGVPVSTLSRFEQKGAGSVVFFSKVLFALGVLDSLDAVVQERIRLALLPEDLSLVPPEKDFLPKRIRARKARPFQV